MFGPCFVSHSSFTIFLMVSLLKMSSWCLVTVLSLFLAVLWVGLQCVIVVLPNHTHLLLRFRNKISGEPLEP